MRGRLRVLVVLSVSLLCAVLGLGLAVKNALGVRLVAGTWLAVPPPTAPLSVAAHLMGALLLLLTIMLVTGDRINALVLSLVCPSLSQPQSSR